MNKTIFFLLFPILGICSTFTFGTKDISYEKRFSFGPSARLLLKRENLNGVLETGFKLTKKDVSLTISHINKDNLLKDSILAKIERKRERKAFRNLTYYAEEGIGVARLPSLFIPGWGPFGPTKYPSEMFILRFDRRLEGKKALKKNLLVWSAGSKGILSSPINLSWDELIDRSDLLGMLSYLRGYFGLKAERGVKGLTIGGGINGFIQSSSYAPITPLQNYEANLKLSKNVADRDFSLSFYYPLKTELFVQDSFDQGERIMLSASSNNWSIEGLAGYEQAQYGLSVNRAFSKFNLSLFRIENKKKDYKTIGLQFTLGGRSQDILKDVISDRKVEIPFYSQYNTRVGAWDNPPSNLSSLGFDETILLLDSPDKVAWYTGKYFTYLSDHNDNLFTIWSPRDVFRIKGGNCTEQMGFEAYALRQHGYEAYTLGMIATYYTHAICIYKDKATGRWNAINFGDIKELQAETPEELLDKFEPDWFSLSIKDPDSAKTIYQIDSSSKGYLIRWFEER